MRNTHEGMYDQNEAVRYPEGRKAIRNIRKQEKNDRITMLYGVA
jgi:hypothetical protein